MTVTGLVQIMHLPALLNQEVVIMRKFTMKGMLDAIVKYKSNELWLVPRTLENCKQVYLSNLRTAILIRMTTDPLVDQYDLSHVLQFNTGAAPLSVEVIEKLARKYPNAGIKQGWGMTESTSCITSTPFQYLHPRFAHTVGKAVSNTLLKIVDVETGLEVGVGTPGEVCIQMLRQSLATFKSSLLTWHYRF